jgi:Fe-S cluster biosynthesis and repair protein YggX
VTEFTCTRCERSDRQPLGTRPFNDERGARIGAEVCTECWEDWKRRQMLLINHYGLNLRDRKARDFLYRNLDAFLFDTGDQADIDDSKEGSVSW